ncbi:MAG: hypothetical protein ACLR6J_11130 [Parabacteroides merdae]
MAAYQKINTWGSATGIKMTIRESEDPAKVIHPCSSTNRKYRNCSPCWRS